MGSKTAVGVAGGEPASMGVEATDGGLGLSCG